MSINYVKGNPPYFCDVNKNKKIKQFKYLNENLNVDVLVVGGGIDGAITLYYLAKAGIKCALIEKERIALCSTSCATALLEYQLDELAEDLKKYMPEEDIAISYKLGLFALEEINKFISAHGNKCNYHKRPSLLYSLQDDCKEFINEFNFRQKHGFNVEYVGKENKMFWFNFNCGLYCEDGGAEFNPYLFTKQALIQAKKLGAQIYENTEAVSLTFNQAGCTVETKYSKKIFCKKVICCTGYNTSLFTTKKLCDKFISYSVVTNVIKGLTWHKKTLLQDNATPYHYIRLTPDNRLLIGGEDIVFKNNKIDEKTANEKYQLLLDYGINFFNLNQSQVTADYKFCGTFSATNNNLALIGAFEDKPDLWCNLGYGANGIIYSVLGGIALADLFLNKQTKVSKDVLRLFNPNRDIV